MPDPLGSPREFAAEVSTLAERVAAGMVLPVGEAALLALLASPLAEKGLIPFPPLDRVLAICDKSRVLGVAPEVGIAVPVQRTISNQGEGRALDPATLTFPLVVKPSRSVSTAEGGRIKLGVTHAATPRQLDEVLRSMPPAAYPLLLQQRIVGPGVGVFLLVWDGRLVAQFSHRRIREKPPAGGVSVYRESVPAEAGLVDRSLALLERFGWRGVAMIEYKLDAATGIPYLMEINGRFWGSLQLAVDSGVDFPRLLLEAAGGKASPPVMSYRSGIRSRWWWGDVDHLIARLRGTPASLGLPPGSPGRVRAVLDFLKLWRPGDRNEIWQWSDPNPFFRETIQWFKGN